MYNRKEIIFNFPLNKEKKINLPEDDSIDLDQEYKTILNRSFNFKEMIKENEWHQEYFLIYNSYVIEGT
ncbi:MAG TPA: hypothetical protein VLN45_06905 [Ignavibacteriaceae bacterium]|nr:hypothetical protein [Ignavibacteriaceae bacterium]